MMSKGKEVFGYGLTIKKANGEVRLSSTFYGETQEATIFEVLLNADTYHPGDAPHKVAIYRVSSSTTHSFKDVYAKRAKEALQDIYGKDAPMTCHNSDKDGSSVWVVTDGKAHIVVNVREVQ